MMMRNRPFDESLKAMPLAASQKAIASKNASASGLVNWVIQVRPASAVLKMRDWSPLPMLSAYAVRASIASMSRMSSAPAPAGDTFCHVAPPSPVRSTVPRCPLTHATSALTALTPRKVTVTPLACDVHVPCAATTETAATLSATAYLINTSRRICTSSPSDVLFQELFHPLERVHPARMDQRVMYVVREDDELVFHTVLPQQLDQPARLRECHVAVIVPVKEQHGRLPAADGADGR
jgi:hypothetical protein